MSFQGPVLAATPSFPTMVDSYLSLWNHGLKYILHSEGGFGHGFLFFSSLFFIMETKSLLIQRAKPQSLLLTALHAVNAPAVARPLSQGNKVKSNRQDIQCPLASALICMGAPSPLCEAHSHHV